MQFWLQSPRAVLLRGSVEATAVPLPPWSPGLFVARATWEMGGQGWYFQYLWSCHSRSEFSNPVPTGDSVGDISG